MSCVYNSSFKDIYDLLEKLCKQFDSSNYREILRHVTQYLSNCPQTLGPELPYDEVVLANKISSHFTNTCQRDYLLDGVDEPFIRYSPQNYNTMFASLHEQLKASQIEQHQRSALLTFLLYMANSEHALTKNNGFSTHTFPTITGDGPIISMKSNAIQKRQGYVHKYSSVVLGRNENVAPACVEVNLPANSSMDELSILETKCQKHCSIKIGQKEMYTLNDDILQNVLYAFTGIEGKYLKKDVITKKFKLNSKAKSLNLVQAGMILRLSELGYYHDLVQSYTDTKSGVCALGLMGQGFITALRIEMTQYYGMVAMLQEQLNKNRNAKANQDSLTLMKLLVWSVDPLNRLQRLANIAQACQEKKGGALASTLYEFSSNGSPMAKTLVSQLLVAVCRPLYHMLSRWLLEGEICDPYGEFFIENLSEVEQSRLWHDKYRLRTSMLPAFISTDLANKILVTGKSINFLCEVCGDKSPVKGRDELLHCSSLNAEHIFSSVADTKLHSIIDSVYLNTSKKVLDIVLGPHKLLEHLQAMRKYLLLGQGDFINILMENLKSELDKPAKELYSYDLSSIMDAAIRSTNAQYDDPEILNHLDVRLLTPCDGDVGWDILTLQYTVHGPLATMLDPSMGSYQVLFKPLWKMKHMEFLLSSKIWKDQMCNAKYLRSMYNQIGQIMYRLHFITSEMIHFIHQMQYYILFEVIECSWAEFQEKVQQARALDDILSAHDEFLNKIKNGAFLDSMEEVYLGIVRLETWQDKFLDLCFKELQSRKDFETDIEKSEPEGKFGLTTEKQLERDENLKIFEQNLNCFYKNLKKIGLDYEIAVRFFLLTLNSNNDHNLQLFGIRLDFNEYYKKRDKRLCVPLTFEHMRMSNVFYNLNTSSRYSVN